MPRVVHTEITPQSTALSVQNSEASNNKHTAIAPTDRAMGSNSEHCTTRYGFSEINLSHTSPVGTRREKHLCHYFMIFVESVCAGVESIVEAAMFVADGGGITQVKFDIHAHSWWRR